MILGSEPNSSYCILKDKCDSILLRRSYLMRFDLSDKEWAVIQPHIPKAGRGPKRVDDRRVLNGIFYILRTGAPWRDLPHYFHG